MGKDGEKKSAHVYILDQQYAWRPAILDDTKGDKAFVTVPEYPDEQSMMSDGGRGAKKGEQRTIDLKQYPHKVLPLQNVDSGGNLTMFADMVKLPYLHEVCKERTNTLDYYYKTRTAAASRNRIPAWSVEEIVTIGSFSPPWKHPRCRSE